MGAPFFILCRGLGEGEAENRDACVGAESAAECTCVRFAARIVRADKPIENTDIGARFQPGMDLQAKEKT